MEDKLVKQIKWCFKINDGLKIVEPNSEISNSYLSLAKTSLKRAEEMLGNKDYLWGTHNLLFGILRTIFLSTEDRYKM